MKLLLVTDNYAWASGLRACLPEHEVLIASQDEALGAFLEFEPDATLVNEHEVSEHIGDRWQKAVRNFKDIRAAATTQKVLCCGFIAQCNPNFLRLPFSPEELLARIT